jgi:hypothetical protein
LGGVGRQIPSREVGENLGHSFGYEMLKVRFRQGTNQLTYFPS